MSKRLDAVKSKVEAGKIYTPDEAFALVKQTSTVKFDATVEVHVRLGIDPGKSDQQIRSTVALPHGTGKTIKIAAFVDAASESAAKEAGADFVYGEEDIKRIKDTGKVEFDIAVSTPTMMPKLAPAAKVLGPKGLMPNPKTDTVGPDIKKIITALKKGKATFKSDDTANVHIGIGKVSFESANLIENYTAFVDALKKARPTSSKGVYIKAVYITSSMGPSIKLVTPS